MADRKLFVVDAGCVGQDWIWGKKFKIDDGISVFASRLAYFQKRWNPEECVVAFDGENLFRRELSPGYRVQFPPFVPAETVTELMDWVQSQGVPYLYDSAFEAGDLAATLISQHEGTAVYVSPKIMARRLVESGRVAVLKTMYAGRERERKPQFYTWPDLVADVFQGLDFPLDDYLCLVGLPGCPGAVGIGPYRARALLGQYGTLVGIQEAWPELKIEDKRLNVPTLEGLRSLFDRLAIVRNVVLFKKDVHILKRLDLLKLMKIEIKHLILFLVI
jgi:5'-3' exonuclease